MPPTSNFLPRHARKESRSPHTCCSCRSMLALSEARRRGQHAHVSADRPCKKMCLQTLHHNLPYATTYHRRFEFEHIIVRRLCHRHGSFIAAAMHETHCESGSSALHELGKLKRVGRTSEIRLATGKLGLVATRSPRSYYSTQLRGPDLTNSYRTCRYNMMEVGQRLKRIHEKINEINRQRRKAEIQRPSSSAGVTEGDLILSLHEKAMIALFSNRQWSRSW